MKKNTVISWVEINQKKTIFLIFVLFFITADFFLGYLLLPKIAGEYNPFFHHGLKSNYTSEEQWGTATYPLITNSLGFKDAFSRRIKPRSDKYRIIILGDSFTEGVGYSYPETFVGLIDKSLEESNVDILNAGVMSYSPKLYFLKTKYLLETLKLTFDELIVYIDISDIQDEIVYEEFSPSKLTFWKNFDIASKNNSFTYNKFLQQFIAKAISSVHYRINRFFANTSPKKTTQVDMQQFYELYHQQRGLWTADNKLLELWGKKGLELAADNMRRLARLCRKHNIKLTIAVYPWKEQIMKREINSIQVTFWEQFSDEINADFINHFPDFINNKNPQEIIQQYFLNNDVHWNKEGHELIAERLVARLISEKIHSGNSN